VILSLMMVSRIPLISMKFSDLKVKGNEGRYILAGLVLVSFAVFGIDAAPLIIPLYIIASLMSRLF
jgi:CDP-diacylglycerol--serine O-phosphatidyltransferase